MDRTRVDLEDGADRSRAYSEAEDRTIAENLGRVAADVYAGKYRDWPQDKSLLCELHSRLFAGVRDHAGRPRDVGAGSERLVFGPHRSSHRDEVGRDLERVLGELRGNMQRCFDDPEAENYELAAVTFAMRAHADVIRIHPFEDGNGRSTRLFLCSVLIVLGLRPIEFELPRQEYLTCLNHYFLHRDCEPLVSLALRLLMDSMEETP